MKNFKNPCWIDRLEEEDPYRELRHQFVMSLNLIDSVSVENKALISEYRRRLDMGKPYRMRCLPYYFIIGMITLQMF